MNWLQPIIDEGLADRTGWLAAATLVAMVSNRLFVAKDERRTGTLLAFLLIHLTLLPVAGWLRAQGHGPEGHAYIGVRLACVVAAAMLAIGIAAHAVFDLVVPRLRLRAPRIVRDLSVAASSLVALFAVASQLGYNLSGLIATSAVVTAVIGFSLQDTLGNIMGGLALQLDNSVGVGDWIKVGEVTGRVTEIRWRYTAVETRNWETVIFPNSLLMKGQVTVLGRRSGQPAYWRRWVWFTVPVEHAPTEVIEAVRAALTVTPIERVAATPPPNVVLMDFNDGGCRYAVRYMLTDLAVDDPTDGAVRARIYFALKRMQIPLSFSTYNVQLHMANRRASEQHDREFDRRLVMLRQLDLFRELEPDAQQHIASVLRYAPFGAGEVMTKQGNVAHWLYVISAGEVSVRVNVDGHEREVSRLHGPAFVGEMGLLTGEPRAATIVAVSDVECYRLDKTAFQHVLDERPELALRISELLTQRRVELEVVREGLSSDAKAVRIAESQSQILSQIKDFFGLGN